MPGIIRVSVREAVDLPDVLADGKIGKDVTAKVTLGSSLFKTQPGIPDRGRIESWNSDFSFPVTNLRDKLSICICDSEDHSVTQTAIDIASIIQKGCRDEFVSLNKGGRIHLKMSFVLTDEERKKIGTMRVAALKRREEAERLKNTVVFQPIQDSPEKVRKDFPVSAAVIAEIDPPTTFARVDSKESPNASLGFDSSPKLAVAKPEPEQASTPEPKQASIPEPKLAPKLMFNYAKAIGMQSASRSADRRSNLVVPDNSSNGDVDSWVGTVKEGAKYTGETDSPDSRDRGRSLVKKPVESAPQSFPIPSGGSDSLANNGGINSEVQARRKCFEEEREAVGLSETAKPDASLPLPSSTDGAASSVKETVDSPPSTQNFTNADTVNNGDRNSEEQTVSAGNAREVGSSGISNLDPSVAEPSFSIGHEPASMGNRATPELPGTSSSGTKSLRIVKARLKRSFSKVFPSRSSRRTSSSSVVARTEPLVPVVGLQDCVRKAVSNAKRCFGALA